MPSLKYLRYIIKKKPINNPTAIFDMNKYLFNFLFFKKNIKLKIKNEKKIINVKTCVKIKNIWDRIKKIVNNFLFLLFSSIILKKKINVNIVKKKIKEYDRNSCENLIR